MNAVWGDSPVFRFDDYSINIDTRHLENLIEVILEFRPRAKILLAVSSVVFSQDQLPEGQKQRVHPRILTAQPFLTPYYEAHRCGQPLDLRGRFPAVVYAGHGLAHVDHRLLDGQTQEMSVVMSCALAFDAGIFVPPYNKYDIRTELICRDHDIQLVRFADGWLHVKYNIYDPEHQLYYLHPYDLTPDQLITWFQAESL